MSKELKTVIGIIIAIYLAYGFFALDVPAINSDELWEGSRGYYFKNHLHNADPLLPIQIAPFFGAIESLGWVSWFIGTIKNASIALTMTVVPLNLWHAVRLNTFLWSMLVCFGTYLFARKLGFAKQSSLLSAAIVVVLPEFFLQVHSERPEMIICFAYLLALFVFLKAVEMPAGTKKKIVLLILGFTSWLPALLIHPSGIIIPPVLGILFLLQHRKKIFDIHTISISIGLVSGLLFFYFVIRSMGSAAISEGGIDLFGHRGPPVVENGWMQIVKAPWIFYNKFIASTAVARPLSFLAYALALFSLLFMHRKESQNISYSKRLFFLGAIFIPLVVLLLFSGSSGYYNVIVVPLVAMVLAMSIQGALDKMENAKAIQVMRILCVFLILIFVSNFLGIKKKYQYVQNYKEVLEEIKSEIPDTASVFGIAAYYEPFRDQHYYSASCFSKYGGRPDQSFEDAVRKLNAGYIIIDDALVALVSIGKGEQWTDSMFLFLDKNALLVKEIKADTYVGKMQLNTNQFPAQWKYEGMEKGIVKRIKIYKVSMS